MVEKVITLDNISLIDFLGVENNNIKEVAAAFPMSKIISRGNEIRIKGTTPEITRISDILDSLLEHYQRYGKITHENVQNYLTTSGIATPGVGAVPPVPPDDDEVLVYGTRGVVVRAKTDNQKRLVEAAEKYDLVFDLLWRPSRFRRCAMLST